MNSYKRILLGLMIAVVVTMTAAVWLQLEWTEWLGWGLAAWFVVSLGQFFWSW